MHEEVMDLDGTRVSLGISCVSFNKFSDHYIYNNFESFCDLDGIIIQV